MRTDRALLPRLVIFGLLVVFGGFAWLTRQPEAPIFERAERLPGAGPWVARLRRLYLPPPPPSGDGGGAEVEVEIVAADPRVLLRRGAWLEEGSVLRELPDPAAPELLVSTVHANVPVLERRGRWHRVRYRGREGWVWLPQRPSTGPPLGSEPLPPGPLPARPADRARLAEARALLGGRPLSRRIGEYELLTDERGVELVGYLDLVATGHEAAYRTRYGLEPEGRALETVVLFSRLADYRAFQQADGIAGFDSSGHMAKGLVATFLEGRSRRQVAATLVHELTHLLNRRALGPALPSWLDEGLADDLAQSSIDDLGRLEPGVLGGESERHDDRIEWSGGLAAAVQLRRELDRGLLPPLAEVVALDWRDFVATSRNQTHYAVSSFLVRYLMREEDPRANIGFRVFLADVAVGRPATGEALLDRLETEWPRLEADFRSWLAGQVPEEWVAEAG